LALHQFDQLILFAGGIRGELAAADSKELVTDEVKLVTDEEHFEKEIDDLGIESGYEVGNGRRREPFALVPCSCSPLRLFVVLRMRIPTRQFSLFVLLPDYVHT
jgi:hypothetical protein